MPLDPRLLDSVVRISSAGDLLGTGSIVSVRSEATPEASWAYVVTAHHVIAHQVLLEIEVPDPLDHGKLFPPMPIDDWWQPLADVDLAIAPFPAELVPRSQATGLGQFIPEGSVVPLGGQVFYLGIFAPLEVPMARGATLGALDIPINVDGYRYTGDLVDCRSYGGFSGSPCFSTLSYAVPGAAASPLPRELVPRRTDGSEIPLSPLGSVAAFCGIFTAHYSDKNPSDGIVSRYGVGVMLPCDYVRVALMGDDAKNQRREWDRDRVARERKALPSLENASATAEPETEFERFEDLTRKLVNTPKPDRG
jgi:hypothetical protein